MLAAGLVVAVLAALLHVYIFVMESLTWTSPRTRATFGTSAEEAETTKLLAFNQGFYNLFLAIVTVLGVVAVVLGHNAVGVALVLTGVGSMAAAAVVLFASARDKARAAATQGTLPAIAIVLVASSLAGGPMGRAQADADFSGLVDIGGGRSLFLDCQGSGSPTVLVIPGKGSYAQAWNYVVPPDDPIRASPYDLIEQADLQPSADAAQPTIARTTRVCVYDRPNTRPDGVDLSTPVAQPHSVADDVDDVVALIGAADLGGPLVVVGHSYGGLIADLLARTHPELVSGLVMVDGVSEFLPVLGSQEQNAAFYRDSATPPSPGDEAVLIEEAFALVNAAPALPDVPAAVLSSGKFAAPEILTPQNYTQAQIHQANTMLADALGTTNVVVDDSGHNVMLYAPDVVAQTVLGVVARVGA